METLKNIANYYGQRIARLRRKGELEGIDDDNFEQCVNVLLADFLDGVDRSLVNSYEDRQRARDFLADSLRQHLGQPVSANLSNHGTYFRRDEERVTQFEETLDEIVGTDGAHLERMRDDALFLGVHTGGRYRKFWIDTDEGSVRVTPYSMLH